MPRRATEPPWIRNLIVTGAALFMLALAISAVFDPRIRVLHILQALIYIAVIVLTRRGSPWGFGAGFLVSAFWNYINLFVTTFIRAGVQQLGILVTTGDLPRPDLFIALIAAGGHFLLMAGCVAGFLEIRPRLRDWLRFAAGGVFAIAYFVAIIATTGRQFLPLFRRVFGLS